MITCFQDTTKQSFMVSGIVSTMMSATLPHVIRPDVPYRPGPLDPRDPRALHALKAAWEGADWAAARTVVLGAPFDAAVPGRKGAREGPRGVREALRFCTSFHAGRGVDLMDARVVDAGDVDMVNTEPGIGESHRRLAAAVQAVAGRGARPVVVGGDNSMSFASVQGCGQGLTERQGRAPRMGLIIADAHHDVREPPPVSSGTPYYRVLRELPWVQPENCIQVGIRPFHNSRHHTERAAKLGITWHTMADVRSRGIGAVAEAAVEQAADGTDVVFLSVDMDAVDQSHAPGVSAPSPSGLLPEELFHLVEEASSLRAFAGADIVETAPPLDPRGNTARVAAHVLLRCCL